VFRVDKLLLIKREY